MEDFIARAVTRSAIIVKASGSIEKYNKLQKLWDDTIFQGYIDLFFEAVNDDFYILWAAEVPEDCDKMTELYRGL